MTYGPNRKFRREYAQLFKQDPVGAAEYTL